MDNCARTKKWKWPIPGCSYKAETQLTVPTMRYKIRGHFKSHGKEGKAALAEYNKTQRELTLQPTDLRKRCAASRNAHLGNTLAAVERFNAQAPSWSHRVVFVPADKATRGRSWKCGTCDIDPRQRAYQLFQTACKAHLPADAKPKSTHPNGAIQQTNSPLPGTRLKSLVVFVTISPRLLWMKRGKLGYVWSGPPNLLLRMVLLWVGLTTIITLV